MKKKINEKIVYNNHNDSISRTYELCESEGYITFKGKEIDEFVSPNELLVEIYNMLKKKE